MSVLWIANPKMGIEEGRFREDLRLLVHLQYRTPASCVG
jgi:hypothetical protein